MLIDATTPPSNHNLSVDHHNHHYHHLNVDHHHAADQLVQLCVLFDEQLGDVGWSALTLLSLPDYYCYHYYCHHYYHYSADTAMMMDKVLKGKAPTFGSLSPRMSDYIVQVFRVLRQCLGLFFQLIS